MRLDEASRFEAAAIADDLSDSLVLHASSERAENEKRYLKSEIQHIGVRVPQIRRTARQFAHQNRHLNVSELFALVAELWDRDVYELRKLAVNILAARADSLGSAEVAAIEALLRCCHTWALIDDLSINVVSPMLVELDDARAIRCRWSKDDDFWVRRTALLAMLPELRREVSHWDEFCEYADAMLPEEEFFIQKAIGWALREVSKHSPDLVADWVKPRAVRLSAVTFREAVKYLPPEHRVVIDELRKPRRRTSRKRTTR